MQQHIKSFAQHLNEQRSRKKVDESFWSNIFGKPGVKDAAHTQRRAHGHSHTGKDSPAEEEHNYIVFQGEKYYQDDIEYADYHDMGKLPRVEDGKLIIANPAWSM